MPTQSLPPIGGKSKEPLKIDQKTLEVIGADSGKVYGKGASLGESLAIQQQMSGGSTPSLSGRPDLYAIEPTAQEKAQMQPIVPQPGMAPVMPKTASGAQLGQIAAGTLPTFAAEQAKPQIPTNFADAARLLTGQAQKDGKEEMYGDTSSKSFDNQLLIQQGLLYKQLFGESLTPAELRVLSPSQQAAVRERNQNAIKAELSGIGSVVAGREERRKEETALKEKLELKAQAQKEKDQDRAMDRFNILSKLGMLDKLNPEDAAFIEQQLGVSPGAISQEAKKEDVEYEIKPTEKGGYVQFKLDAKTKKVLEIIPLIGRGGSGGGSGGGLSGSGSKTNLSSRAQAVYENPELLQNFTPTEKGKIIDELAKSGLDTKRLTLEKTTAAQKDNIDKLDTVLREAEYAKKILESGLKTGPLQTRVAEGGAVLGLSKQFTQYKSAVSNMNSILLQARSGAAVSDQEYERIKGFIPLVTDDENTAKVKIERFYDAMKDSKQNYIMRATQNSFDLLGDVDLQSKSSLDDLNFKF